MHSLDPLDLRLNIESTAGSQPALWGLRPHQLHDLFWEDHGIQVVRPANRLELTDGLFLLLPRFVVVHVERHRIIELIRRHRSGRFSVLSGRPKNGYEEWVITDSSNRFVRFERSYPERQSTQFVVTDDRAAARLWQQAEDSRSGHESLNEYAPHQNHVETGISAFVYDARVPRQIKQGVHDLMSDWRKPGQTIDRIAEVAEDVWADSESTVDPAAKIAGRVWVGVGRHLNHENSVRGPAVLWDDPQARPVQTRLVRLKVPANLESNNTSKPRRLKASSPTGKRAFDIVAAVVGLAFSLPIYPFILLAIWLEDGRPFFFGHRRETSGGREFWCWKLRSMRRDADRIKTELQSENEVDGPQFFMENDPRLTRVGRYLRKSKLDELPQFFNVLMGHMSFVGPRPSPFVENQYCPTWRETRLSVRPGITGLWQLKRTREAGCDFQEWIKYDIEYVENVSWRLDLWILWNTILKILRELF